MGQAKVRQRTAFSQDLIEEWESHDCIDFAFALGRLSGWLLHVDWWSTSPEYNKNEQLSEKQLTPIRVYVADNKDMIFDPRGKMSIFDFNERIVIKQARARGFNGGGGVLTRFYDEDRFASLPLRYRPDEDKIARAIAEIQKHPTYLTTIPVRRRPCLPAYQAARFSYGSCAVFAEALQERTGLQPTALLAIRFVPGFEGTRVSERGYFHSVGLHADGTGEDSWGRASLTEIAARFGVAECVTSADEHRAVVQRIKQATPDVYATRYRDALSLIQEYIDR